MSNQYRPVNLEDLKAAFAKRKGKPPENGIKQVMPYVFVKTRTVRKPK